LLTGFLAVQAFGGGGLADGVTPAAQFGVQATGVVVTGLWSLVATAAIVLATRAMVGLRVTDEEETEGLDFVQHGETGYRL
jgi:Amt family ammonium transporter